MTDNHDTRAMDAATKAEYLNGARLWARVQALEEAMGIAPPAVGVADAPADAASEVEALRREVADLRDRLLGYEPTLARLAAYEQWGGKSVAERIERAEWLLSAFASITDEAMESPPIVRWKKGVWQVVDRDLPDPLRRPDGEPLPPAAQATWRLAARACSA